MINTFEEKWKNNKDLAFNETLREGSKIQNWILERNGFANLNEFKGFIRCKNRILDAGCGNGRVTALMAKHNPNAKVIAMDLFTDVAKENLKDYKNVIVLKADLDKEFDALETFDFIYCQEVLHHLKNPKESFHNLCTLLEKNGEIAIYVYKKKAMIREASDEIIRDKVKDLDYASAIAQLSPITELGRILQNIDGKIKIPQIDLLEIPKGEYTVHELVYNFFCKCYYNPEIGRQGSNAINFDWYHPTISSKHTAVEVMDWFKEEGMEITHQYVDAYGITIWGIKR